MKDSDWTRILGWPGYRVYRQEIDENAKTLKLWVRRKRGNRKLICSGCGRKLDDAMDLTEREVRDLPWGQFRTTVVIELYRVRCQDCGPKIEKVDQLPGLLSASDFVAVHCVLNDQTRHLIGRTESATESLLSRARERLRERQDGGPK